jgi:hypothetical protein
VGPRERRQPAQHADKRQVYESRAAASNHAGRGRELSMRDRLAGKASSEAVPRFYKVQRRATSWACQGRRGPRRDEPHPAQALGQQLAQSAEQRSVDPGQRWAWSASSQYGGLMSEHQDFDVLGCVGSGQQRQPAQHAGERQVSESKCHGQRSCWAACELLLRGRLAANALIRGRDTVFGIHRIMPGRLA